MFFQPQANGGREAGRKMMKAKSSRQKAVGRKMEVDGQPAKALFSYKVQPVIQAARLQRLLERFAQNLFAEGQVQIDDAVLAVEGRHQAGQVNGG